MAKGDLRWALFRAAAYLRGRGVTFGQPLIPQLAINEGIYSVAIGLVKAPGIAGFDSKLDIFADGSLDHVLVTGMVGGLDEPSTIIKEASSKLKKGGHLVVLTDVNDTRPGIYPISPSKVEDWVGESGKWIRKLNYTQDERNLQIYKRVEGKRGFTEWQRPEGRRALVVRYGALGDAIVMTPLLRALHEDNYHVTTNINPYCLDVLRHNPNIDNILIQERDIVPNHLLGEYWNVWEGEYDKYINLCESIEGDLLQVEGRPSYFTSKKWRHEQGNKNYYDYALARGGYSALTGQRGELYFTDAEERRAKKFFEPLKDKFVILWALNGSSHHKVYPMMEPTLVEWFSQHKDSIVITVGDQMARLMEFEHPQLQPKAGAWKIRESLIATKYANLVIGPETMMTNASGCFSTPKITLLSHSSKENLTKYWENDHSLEPSTKTAPCYPCHQLHYTKESCPMGEMTDISTGEMLGQAPICSLAIAPQVLLAEMDKVYQEWKNGRSYITV